MADGSDPSVTAFGFARVMAPASRAGDVSSCVQKGLPTPLTTNGAPATTGGCVDSAVRGRIERVLELIRPAVQSDGGDIELVGVTDDGIVQIRLHGACVGCPSSQVTLQVGVERNLKDHIPEVRSVQAVD
jgi:Fe-S cluster biogenesis protein NfuA